MKADNPKTGNPKTGNPQTDISDRPIIRLAWRVSQEHPFEFWIGFAGFLLFFSIPALSGYLTAQAFEALTGNDIGTLYFIAGALLLAELARLVAFSFGAVSLTKSWTYMRSLMQGNLLHAQLVSGGEDAGPPARSAGDALSRFRDDTNDIVAFIDLWLDAAGGFTFTLISVGIMFQINATATLVAVVPLMLGALVVLVMDGTIKQWRRDDRAATRAVAAMLGDVMAGATAVKVNDATEPVLGRFQHLVDTRRRTAVRDRTLNEAIFQLAFGATDVATALVLVVGAGAIASGEFAFADLVLFLAYLPWLSNFPRQLSRLITRHRQAIVSFEGMEELVAENDPDRVVRQIHLPVVRGRDRRIPFEFGYENTLAQPGDNDHELLVRPERTRVPLERLTVENLTIGYQSAAINQTTSPIGAPVVSNVSFDVEAGAFVVITGRIGSGKSTLLRTLLGLANEVTVTGSIRWNGEEVVDHGAFFVPPQCAFVSQIPQLLSDSLADNILLGTDPGPDRSDEDLLPVGPPSHPAGGSAGMAPVAGSLATAVRAAAMTDDVAMMPDGLATVVGPRGLRLSGGQRQRVAAARALVQRPELLVVDDLSSALDVATEFELWENVADAGITVLAVSHRPKVLEKADLIVDLG